MDRKLAAILAADVVGYSAMMERDEAGTHQLLRQGLRDLFEPTIARYHGNIFKLMGDGLLAEFSSVVEAVECAVALQRGLAERNADVPEGQRVVLRIGVNLGEVIVEGDDRFGEGVNVAARLEQIAEPGGIWVSAKVAREVEKKLAFGFEAMGAQKVKNLVEPVEAYRVQMDGKPFAASPAVPAPAPGPPPMRGLTPMMAGLVLVLAAAGGGLFLWQRHSAEPPAAVADAVQSAPAQPPAPKPVRLKNQVIAVIPFANMSGDPKLDYFSDGMTDNLISLLTGVTELSVISRNSSYAYKGKTTDVRQIGQELNAGYIIEGSIWKDADRVRVTAQLIDVRTGENVWAEKFDRTGADPLALQDKVAERIVGTLGGQRGVMYQNEYKFVWEKEATQLEAYDYYLRGNSFFQQWTPDSSAEALRITEEGLTKYPGSALLRCALAWDHTLIATNVFDLATNDHWNKASDILRETLKRPDLKPDERKSCLWASIYVNGHEGRFDQVQRAVDEVLTLAPGDAFLVGDLSNAARWLGQTEKALERAEYGLKNDPNFAHYYLSLKAQALTDVERYAESAEILQNTSDLTAMVPLLRAVNYRHLGKPDQAKAEVAKAKATLPWITAAGWRDNTFHKDPAVIDRQVADLISAGLPTK